MKLSRLVAAINAAPKVYVRFSFGPVPLEKTGLKAALRAQYGPAGNPFVPLAIDPGGFLIWEVTSD